MNGEQAAASLFGPEDPTSDPFASLGSQQSPVTEQDFFASFPVADPPVADSTDDVQSVELTGPAQPVPYIVNEPVATGWYDDFGRWNEQSVEQAPRTDPSLAFPPSSTSVEAPTYPQPVPVSTHDTYVPELHRPPSVHSTPQGSYPYNSHVSIPTLPSDPYTPNSDIYPTNQSTARYPSQAPTSTYSPASYTPSSYALSTQASTYTSPPQPKYNAPKPALNGSAAYQGSSFGASIPPPGPPVSKPALNRPVTSNAYDPPFLPTKRKPSSRQRPGLNASSQSLPPPLPRAPYESTSYGLQQAPMDLPLRHDHPQFAPSASQASTFYSSQGDTSHSMLAQNAAPSRIPIQSSQPFDPIPSYTMHDAQESPNPWHEPTKISQPDSPPLLLASHSKKDPSSSSHNGDAGSALERAASPALSYDRATSGARPYTGSPVASTGSAGTSYPSPPADPYAPKSIANGPTLPRPPVLPHSTPISGAPEGPYAPSHRQAPSGLAYTSQYNETSPSNVQYAQPSQELTVKQPLNGAYAPSPSLMGTNDPLGRTSGRPPVFSFGFGGKFVTCFHGASTMNTGFDVALASRNSTSVEIRILNKHIPQSALESSAAVFPGPLYLDPGTPTNSLVRTGSSAQTKSKKAKVLKYLSEREDELSQSVGFLHTDAAERQQEEGKLILVKVLKIMVEYDGKISGLPSIDAALRKALVPRLDISINGIDADNATTIVPGFSTMGDIHGNGLDPHEVPISTNILRPSHLGKIQDFLLQGKRREAYHYALDERMWAHAMVIASGIDKEAWKEVVNEFLKAELGPNTVKDGTAAGSNGRESLRVAYSLYSGQGPSAVKELVPPNLLSRANGLAAPTMHATPLTPNFMLPGHTNKLSPESLSSWADTVAMILTTTPGTDTLATLTALGDQLLTNDWVAAAHVCYLLSPQNSPLGAAGQPTSRITLLGGNVQSPNFGRDPDSLNLTEVLEFALSLATPSKGQEPFFGLPYLQPYRFQKALALAELGDVTGANRYCDAIIACSGRPSLHYPQFFLEQVRGLSARVSGVSHGDKAGSWMGGKISKPSLDTIGGWLEGRFTKLVTGDVDSPSQSDDEAKKSSGSGFVGPFSHYSTISSTTTSTSPSPQPSLLGPPRTNSAMSNHLPLNQYAPIDRASSAMDYVPHRQSPGLRVASAGATTTTFSQSPSFGQALQQSPYSPMKQDSQDQAVEASTPRPNKEEDDQGQEVSWWSSYGHNSQTPRAATFVSVADSEVSLSSDGFISLMDSTPFTTAPASPAKHPVVPSRGEEDDSDDLGLGNSKPKPEKNRDAIQDKDGNKQPSANPAPAQPAQNTPQGSWLSRWWKGSSGGPVKANLGEEVSFYYDKELKKWVNKSSAAEEPSKPPGPPPPSRAQTASPGMTGARPPPGNTPAPPPRSASAANLTSSSPPPASHKNVTRIRSNLVPTAETESAPSTPTGTRSLSPGPPPSRPRSQASGKRNIRSRYVDVFQEGSS